MKSYTCTSAVDILGEDYIILCNTKLTYIILTLKASKTPRSFVVMAMSSVMVTINRVSTMCLGRDL